MNDQPYKYGGAEALVVLHDQHLREFWNVWRQADEQGIQLPATEDRNYASREALLTHVMGCAASYLTWICEQIGEPAPNVVEYPEVEGFGGQAATYMEQVLAAWPTPLRNIKPEQADHPTYVSRWGTPYSIDAMLEHAVMHPIRHSHQLRGLMIS